MSTISIPEFDEVYEYQSSGENTPLLSMIQHRVLCHLIDKSDGKELAFGLSRMGNGHFKKEVGKSIAYGNAMRFLMLKLNTNPNIIEQGFPK
jgi:hypothetical protein